MTQSGGAPRYAVLASDELSELPGGMARSRHGRRGRRHPHGACIWERAPPDSDVQATLGGDPHQLAVWRPGYALLGLLLAGVALRLIAIVQSWWPAATTLDDNYQSFTSNPFENPLHPAGYSLIVGGLGLVTREIAVTILIQHLSGIAAGLLLWAATRRVTGSAWAGLLPAGIVLLDPDLDLPGARDHVGVLDRC